MVGRMVCTVTSFATVQVTVIVHERSKKCNLFQRSQSRGCNMIMLARIERQNFTWGRNNRHGTSNRYVGPACHDCDVEGNRAETRILYSFINKWPSGQVKVTFKV
jgi:hypothetical protein